MIIQEETIILEVGFGSGNQSVAIDDIYLSNSSCSGNDTAADFLTNSKTTGKDETGIIVGVVCGVGFIIGLVFVLWYWRRRSKQRTKSNGQDMFINDLNGNQTVALPPEHESRKTEVLFKNINARNQVPSDINYDLAHSFGEDVMDNYIKPSSPPINDYDILDPNETGFNRSQFKAERQTEYEMAVSINHVENEPDLQDPYAVNENGTYDTSNNKLHKEEDTKLYSHTVDSVYDTTLHDVNRRQMDDDDGTYNHVFCEKTEDDYDVTKRE